MIDIFPVLSQFHKSVQLNMRKGIHKNKSIQLCNKGKNRINPIKSLEGSEAGQRNLDLSEPIMIVLNVEHALYPSSSFSFTSSFSSIIIKGKFCMNQSGKCGKYSGRRTLHVYLYIGSLDIFSVSHYFFFTWEHFLWAKFG